MRFDLKEFGDYVVLVSLEIFIPKISFVLELYLYINVLSFVFRNLLLRVKYC